MESIITNSGNKLTIVSEKVIRCGKRNRKLYEVTCEICSLDAELFPNTFLTRKGSLRTPCACSKSYQYTLQQLQTLISRKSKDIVFVGWNRVNTKHTKMSYPVLKCIKHNTTVTSTNCQQYLANNQFGCAQCKSEKLTNSLNLTEEVVNKKLQDTGLFHKEVKFFRTEGKKNMWSYNCPICSDDLYVKAGVCSGVFTSFIGSLFEGSVSCRCARGYKWTKEQQELRVKQALLENNRHHEFIGWVGEYKGARTRLRYLCGNGHGEVEVKAYSLTTSNNDCRFCSILKNENSFGKYVNRLQEEDNLYLVILSNSVESFLKIGRAFDIDIRFGFYKPLFNVNHVANYIDIHDNIFSIEKIILNEFASYKYTPLTKFGGDTECFSMEVLPQLTERVKNL